MRLVSHSFASSCLALFVAGCSQASSNPLLTDGGAEGGPAVNAHAEGAVTLGESHAANGGKATPAVSAAFAPDSSAKKTCGAAETAGCKVVRAPKCSVACATDEICSFDDQCMPTCKRACTKACQPGEECYFPSLGADPSCRRKEAFDSGAITIGGAVEPIELYPPYTWSSAGTGSPFAAGATLEVKASGAQIAGFSAWDRTVTATTPLTTAIGKLSMAEVYSTDPLTVRWTAGNDTITISLSGNGGSATCEAPDGDGSFDVPREVVDQALGGASRLAISVSRRKEDTVKGIATRGTLATAKVQPEGWATIGTFSTESISFQGCTNLDEAVCGGKCTNTQSNAANCGKCGNACGSGEQCVLGQCKVVATCSQCTADAKTGACKAENDKCNANPACVNLGNCLAKCADQTCAQSCAKANSAGITDYNARVGCFCKVACTLECASVCK